MIQSPDLADRVAALSLRFLAAFNALLFLSFLLVLVMATGRAHAQVPFWAGENIVDAGHAPSGDSALCDPVD